jgi:hypothetical protein
MLGIAQSSNMWEIENFDAQRICQHPGWWT